MSAVCLDASHDLAHLNLVAFGGRGCERASTWTRNGQGGLVGLEFEELVTFSDYLPVLLEPCGQNPGRNQLLIASS